MDAPRSHAPRAAGTPVASPTLRAPDLAARMKVLAHDMERARQGVAAGRIQPQYYAFLARMLEGRLEAIEAEVLHKARRDN